MTTTWIETDKHVYGTILREHKKDFVVYAGCSAPEGDQYWSVSHPLMMTEYGFKNANLPLIKIVETKKTIEQKDWDCQYFIAVNSLEE